jgi:hypothetical protein
MFVHTPISVSLVNPLPDMVNVRVLFSDVDACPNPPLIY